MMADSTTKGLAMKWQIVEPGLPDKHGRVVDVEHRLVDGAPEYRLVARFRGEDRVLCWTDCRHKAEHLAAGVR